MGENDHLDRTIDSGANKVINSVATVWTDEKHKSYLNTIEATFVKQLYNCEYGSNDLFSWLSRTRTHTTPSGINLKKQSLGQFKVLHRGCWENFEFDGDDGWVKNEIESHNMYRNNWIQHFRSCAKEPHLALADEMENNNKYIGKPVHLLKQRNGGDAAGSKRGQPFWSHELHKVSIGSITEVSDQNFIDVETGKEEGISKRHRKKRPRRDISPITGRVVPFVFPTSDENNEGCSKATAEKINDSPHLEPEPLPPKYQTSNTLTLKAR